MAFGDITIEVLEEFAEHPPIYEWHKGIRIYDPTKIKNQMAVWRAANPARAAEIARRYRYRDRPKYLAQKKAQDARYRAANPERYRESNRRSYLKRKAAGKC